ncbi:MAG: hypothetical protein GY754_34685 [bacterium]|nr:hypothetical protein [bacterium]
MRKDCNIRFCMILMLVLTFGQGLYAQTGGSAEKDTAPAVVEKKAETADKPAAEAKKAEAVVEKAAKTAVNPENKDAEVKTQVGSRAGANDLLYIKDSAYKYQRIPGIELDEKQSTSEEEDVVAVAATVEKTSETVKKDGTVEKGLFGLGKKATDYFVWGSLIVLILLLVIIYKVRSGGSRRRVFK